MGENHTPPQENGGSNHNENEIVDEEMNSVDENEDEIDDMTPEEFENLDKQLDSLNSALDDIEQKNDNIHAQLLELLNENRAIRQQLQESNNAVSTPSDSNVQEKQ